MKENWKGILAVLLVIGAGVFAYARWRVGFGDRAPRFVELTEAVSPSATWHGSIRRSWPHVETVLKQLEYEMKLTDRRGGSVLVAVLTEAAEAAVCWSTMEIGNPGFAAMTRYETGRPLVPERFIGYYSMAGQPLSYVTKKDPRLADVLQAAVVLPDPLPPGETVRIFRVDRRPDLIQTNKQDQLFVPLGPLRPSADRVDAAAVVLPKGARVIRQPTDESAGRKDSQGQTSLIWFSTFVETPQPLTVTYTLE